MSKIYLIYYDFNNTSGNHAGMAYLARYLEENINNINLIRTPDQEFKGGRYLAKLYSIFLAFYLRLVLTKSDKILYFEYLTMGVGHQDFIAKLLRNLGVKNKMIGLVHYSGSHLLEFYQKEENILRATAAVDKLLVLGSSLAEFLLNIRVKPLVDTTFHYVDTDYYKPARTAITNDKLQVLCLGTLKRDFAQLKKIVEQCAEAQFHVCMGRKNLLPVFGDLSNVKLYGFLSEPELLKLMQRCNASLSVLEDTVGSNVITSSLATGLIQIVSDVGSIRDYCDNTNSFLCNTVEDFIVAIQRLSIDKILTTNMEKAARKTSLKFSKENFLSEFNNLLN